MSNSHHYATERICFNGKAANCLFAAFRAEVAPSAPLTVRYLVKITQLNKEILQVVQPFSYRKDVKNEVMARRIINYQSGLKSRHALVKYCPNLLHQNDA